MKKFLLVVLSLVFFVSGSMIMQAEVISATDNQGNEYSFDVILDEENGKYTIVTAFDDEGNEFPIIVELEDNKVSQISSYGYWKNCGDDMGCPGVVHGTMNGANFVVYRQNYNWNGSSAYYSGWLYD